MIEVLSLSVISWWIAVGCGLVQKIKWFFDLKRLHVIDCSKCLGFWVGLNYGLYNYEFKQTIVLAILVSATAIAIEKGMNRL